MMIINKLVNTKKMLIDAKNGKYAVPQFNINNLEWAKVVLELVQEEKSPVILGVSEGAAKYMGGYSTIVGMVNGLIGELNITVPVALHLDHGTTVESTMAAIDAGFSSVMYDGSRHTIEQNVKETKEVVEYAKTKDVSVEAEVGTVGGEEDGIVGGINYASLSDVEAMATTGIDSLAASLGSVHGHYQGEPDLQFDLMNEYSVKIRLPLVLHGGTGIPDDMVRKAIEAGEAKINVNTELQTSFTKGVRRYIEEEKDKFGTGYDPRKVLGTYAWPEIKKAAKLKVELFGSKNKG